MSLYNRYGIVFRIVNVIVFGIEIGIVISSIVVGIVLSTARQPVHISAPQHSIASLVDCHRKYII